MTMMLWLYSSLISLHIEIYRAESLDVKQLFNLWMDSAAVLKVISHWANIGYTLAKYMILVWILAWNVGVFTFCQYCTIIGKAYFDYVKPIFAQYFSFMRNISNIKPTAVQYGRFIGNIFNLKPIFLEYWRFSEDISNVKPIFALYWHFNGNISNIKPMFVQYCHFIGKIFKWSQVMDTSRCCVILDLL